MSLILQEVTQDGEVEIPGEVRQVYAQWRWSPLFRAGRLEKALDTPARIYYYKYDGVSPAGSHKRNTAVPRAYYNKKEGTKRSLDRNWGREVGDHRRPWPARFSDLSASCRWCGSATIRNLIAVP